MTNEPQITVPRPLSLTFVGWVFIIGGLSTVWRGWTELCNHRIMLDPSVLKILVGIGLLRGKRSSVFWARLWIVFNLPMSLIAALVCFKILNQWPSSLHDPLPSRQEVWGWLSVNVVLDVFSWCVLSSSRTQQFIASRQGFSGNGDFPQPDHDSPSPGHSIS